MTKLGMKLAIIGSLLVCSVILYWLACVHISLFFIGLGVILCWVGVIVDSK